MERHLQGQPEQIDVKSPEEAARGTVIAYRKVIREQGQVMSSALENNENLWNTNKALRKENELLKDTCRRLEGDVSHLRRLNEQLSTPVNLTLTQLQGQNANLIAMNKQLCEELTRQSVPELNDTDARQAMLEKLKAQKKDLFETGMVPAPEPVPEDAFGPMDVEIPQ